MGFANARQVCPQFQPRLVNRRTVKRGYRPTWRISANAGNPCGSTAGVLKTDTWEQSLCASKALNGIMAGLIWRRPAATSAKSDKTAGNQRGDTFCIA
jgi:hypothetical protein